MPFARPTLASLIDSIRSDMRGALEETGPLVRRAMADVLAAVWGGAVHLLHGYVAWVAMQLFARTAERDALILIGAMWGVTPTPATFAAGNVTATGTTGATVPTGAVLKFDAATSYRVTTGGTLVSGVAVLPVVAVTAGSGGNQPAAAALTFESPISGVAGAATVASGGLVGGLDVEDTEPFRARLLQRMRNPPNGGTDADYIGWARAVPGTTRAWVFRRELGLGTVVVRFVRDGEVPIFPDAGEVATMQAALDAMRPTTAAVTAAAPTSLAVAFTIHLVPDTTDTRAAVTAQLTDTFGRLAEPGDGAGRGKVPLSQIRTAIGVAAGVTDYTLTVPSADVVPGVGQLPVVGAITWV